MKALITQKNALIAVIIAIASTTGGSVYFKNIRLENHLTSERLKAENLLSQKLQLDKTLVLAKKELIDFQKQNGMLKNTLTATEQQISKQGIEINKLSTQSISIKELKKQIEELEAINENQNKETEKLRSTLSAVQTVNRILSEKIADEGIVNSRLKDDNSILKAFISDNYRTEAIKSKNEKLTVNARKARRLMVSFDLPANTSTKQIHYKILTPDGTEYISDKDLAAEIKIIDNTAFFSACSDPLSFGPSGKKRIEISFQPKQKLNHGLYHFNLYNGDRFLGSTQLRLK